MSEEDDPREQKCGPERFRFAEIAGIRPNHKSAGDPVTTFVPHFSLGEKSRFEDHYSSLFYRPETENLTQYHFHWRESSGKKRGQQFVPRDVGVLFGDSLVLGDGLSKPRSEICQSGSVCAMALSSNCLVSERRPHQFPSPDSACLDGKPLLVEILWWKL